jgi:hypothetical protein
MDPYLILYLKIFKATQSSIMTYRNSVANIKLRHFSEAFGSMLRLSPITSPKKQDTFHIFGSAIAKGFNTYFLSSPTTGPKRELFLQMSLHERGYSFLGCASAVIQNGSHI